MSRSAKRIFGNVSVLIVLVALVAVVAFSATSPNLLQNDAKLTAEANAGTPIVQAASESQTAPEKVVAEAASIDSQNGVESDPKQSWANEKMNQWLNNEGASSVRGFVAPFNLIQSWESKKAGEITLTVDNAVSIGDDVFHEKLGPANNLWIITAVMMSSIGDESSDVKSIVAVTEDGERTETYTREDEKHSRAVESGEYVYP